MCDGRVNLGRIKRTLDQINVGGGIPMASMDDQPAFEASSQTINGLCR